MTSADTDEAPEGENRKRPKYDHPERGTHWLERACGPNNENNRGTTFASPTYTPPTGRWIDHPYIDPKPDQSTPKTLRR